MEEIIIPILQTKQGVGYPNRVHLPQEEVVELPCTDTAIPCVAALGDLPKVTQDICIIVPLNSNLLHANPSIFTAGQCSQKPYDMSKPA